MYQGGKIAYYKLEKIKQVSRLTVTAFLWNPVCHQTARFKTVVLTTVGETFLGPQKLSYMKRLDPLPVHSCGNCYPNPLRTSPGDRPQ